MKKVAVVLSGCGVFDGAEINESILTLLALEERNIAYECFAPNIEQHHTIDHTNGSPIEQTRNVLVESARIVRGNIQHLDSLKAQNFSALIVPGGFGVAKNLSTFAFDGVNFAIEGSFQRVMNDFSIQKKPSGYMCIAPVLLPKVYNGIKCTIGNDNETACIINALGGIHVNCDVNDIVIDTNYNVVTTPAYMLAQNMVEARNGINRLIDEVISMI